MLFQNRDGGQRTKDGWFRPSSFVSRLSFKYFPIFVFCISLLANTFNVKAQLASPTNLSYSKNKSIGKKLIKQGATSKAVSYLEAANEKKPGKKKLVTLLAEAEKNVRNYAAAESLYAELEAKDKKSKKPEYTFYKGIALQQQQKYAAAIDAFNTFKNLTKGNDKYAEQYKMAGKAIEGAKLGVAQTDSTVEKPYKAIHLNNEINTAATERAPALRNGNFALFSRMDENEVMKDGKVYKYASIKQLHQAGKTGKEWKYIGLENSLTSNAGAHLATPSFTEDGNTLYYSLCKEEIPLKLRCDIYRSTFANGAWTKGEKLNTSVNLSTATNLWACAGKAPGGEEALYFSSDRNPSKGFDIFYAIRNGDGTFQRAKTLSTFINTKDDDIAPFYDYETNTLYFSSNGRGGLGGFDVFGAKRLVIGDFLEPENVGMPINSGADDYGFVYNPRKNTGFVTSNRNSVTVNNCSTCNDDIWLIESAILYPAVKGEITYGREGLKQLATNATIALYEANGTDQLGFTQAVNGKYFFDLEKEKQYRLLAKREGANDVEQKFSTMNISESDTFTFNLNFEELIPDNFIGVKLATVFWDYDKFQLTKDAPDSLAKVVQFMTEHPNHIVEVGSHTDSKGNDDYNLKLSERRSAAVIKYLLSKKLAGNRIINKPYGESQPAAPNTQPDGSDFEAGRMMNRRTEFKVLEEVK